jgi:hypothetical protein
MAFLCDLRTVRLRNLEARVLLVMRAALAHLQLGQPGGQCAAVALEATEVPTVLGHRAVGLLDENGDHMQHAMHIDAGHAPVQRGKSFHEDAPVSKVPRGTQERHLWPARRSAANAAQRQAGELEGSSNRNRFGPLYRTCCPRATAMAWAAQQSGVRASSVEVRLGTGVGPSFVLRPLRACVPPHMVHLPRAFMLGGEWTNS